MPTISPVLRQHPDNLLGRLACPIALWKLSRSALADSLVKAYQGSCRDCPGSGCCVSPSRVLNPLGLVSKGDAV